MTNFYFATDGNWGGADGLVTVDASDLDDHFLEYVDSVGEYERPEWAAWFAKNNHAIPLTDTDGMCYYCDNFEVGTLQEIDDDLDTYNGV
jgi:hypothetical protein